MVAWPWPAGVEPRNSPAAFDGRRHRLVIAAGDCCPANAASCPVRTACTSTMLLNLHPAGIGVNDEPLLFVEGLPADDTIDFGSSATPRSLRIGNRSSGRLVWTALPLPKGFRLTPDAGVVTDRQLVTLEPVRSEITAPVTATLTLRSSGGTKTLTLKASP